jgi:hypothetical protein
MSWIPPKKGWLTRESHPRPEKSPEEQDPSKEELVAIIRVAACPQCQSRKIRNYSGDGRVRYYYCLNGCKDTEGKKYAFKAIVENA